MFVRANSHANREAIRGNHVHKQMVAHHSLISTSEASLEDTPTSGLRGRRADPGSRFGGTTSGDAMAEDDGGYEPCDIDMGESEGPLYDHRHSSQSAATRANFEANANERRPGDVAAHLASLLLLIQQRKRAIDGSVEVLQKLAVECNKSLSPCPSCSSPLEVEDKEKWALVTLVSHNFIVEARMPQHIVCAEGSCAHCTSFSPLLVGYFPGSPKNVVCACILLLPPAPRPLVCAPSPSAFAFPGVLLRFRLRLRFQLLMGLEICDSL